MTWRRDGIFVGHSRVKSEQLITHADLGAAGRGDVVSYASDGRVLARTPQRLLLAHQIEWAIDRLLVVDTGRERLSAYAADGELMQEVTLGEHDWDHGPNGRLGHHFNSVHRSGERVWVVAHNHSNPSELWELSWPQLELVEVHVTGAAWAHNVWDGELGLVTCDSRFGRLHEVRSGETLWTPEVDGAITRGLAVGPEHLFIGRSGFGERSARLTDEGGLWVLDRATLTTVEEFGFPGSGCINEVRLLDGPDECHNGEPFDEKMLTGLARRDPARGSRLSRLQAVFRDRG